VHDIEAISAAKKKSGKTILVLLFHINREEPLCEEGTGKSALFVVPDAR
jgi:hypothetical protein